MRSDITNYLKSCIQCQRYKPTNLKPAGLMQTVASNQRFEVIAIDLVGPLPKSSEGYQWIFVVEDLCSRWVELFALKEATAQNCALTLLNEVLLRYGLPRRIHSDNGCQFISALMQKLTFVLGIKQTFTPVYHPEANPVKRKNRHIKTQLSILAGNDHTNWNLNLPSIRFAMNSVKCASTGFSAAYLTFGRELRSPTEVFFDLKHIIQSETFIPQITPHLERMANTLALADESQQRLQDKNKTYADKNRKPHEEINVGDEVLVNTHVLSQASKGITSKLIPRRDGPYIVLSKQGALCYEIASKENPNIPLGTHHVRDLTLYKGTATKPLYPIRRRGRPNKQNKDTNIIKNNPSSISQPETNATQSNTTTTTSSELPETEDDNVNLRRSKRVQEAKNKENS